MSDTKHLSLPLRKGLKGFFATSSGNEAIRENLEQIIFVGPLQRVFRMDIGFPLGRLVWEPVDEIFDSLLKTYIRDRVHKFETRITIKGITVEREILEDGSYRVNCYIQYVRNGTRKLETASVGADFSRSQ